MVQASRYTAVAKEFYQEFKRSSRSVDRINLSISLESNVFRGKSKVKRSLLGIFRKIFFLFIFK